MTMLIAGLLRLDGSRRPVYTTTQVALRYLQNVVGVQRTVSALVLHTYKLQEVSALEGMAEPGVGK